MADIRLRKQFPATPDLSVAVDEAEHDVYLIEQFPAAPDLSVHAPPSGVRLPTGPVTLTLALAAQEAQDTAAFTMTVTGGGTTHTMSISATEAADLAAFGLVRGHPLTLAATEAADVMAAVMVRRHMLALTATEGADTAAFAMVRQHMLAMAASEAQDTAAFSMTVVGTKTMSIAASEGADTASFSLAGPPSTVQQQGGTSNRGPSRSSRRASVTILPNGRMIVEQDEPKQEPAVVAPTVEAKPQPVVVEAKKPDPQVAEVKALIDDAMRAAVEARAIEQERQQREEEEALVLALVEHELA